MKLAMLGATGFVGTVLIAKAVSEGHQVRVLVRNPNKLQDLGSVDVLAGDMHEPALVQQLVRDTDAVISVAGPPLNGRHDSRSHADAMTYLTDAMRSAGVQRLITVAGAAAKAPGQRLTPAQAALRAVLTVLKPDVIKTKDLELAIVCPIRAELDGAAPASSRPGQPVRARRRVPQPHARYPHRRGRPHRLHPHPATQPSVGPRQPIIASTPRLPG